jgi:hypothetical protein
VAAVAEAEDSAVATAVVTAAVAAGNPAHDSNTLWRHPSRVPPFFSQRWRDSAHKQTDRPKVRRYRRIPRDKIDEILRRLTINYLESHPHAPLMTFNPCFSMPDLS